MMKNRSEVWTAAIIALCLIIMDTEQVRAQRGRDRQRPNYDRDQMGRPNPRPGWQPNGPRPELYPNYDQDDDDGLSLEQGLRIFETLPKLIEAIPKDRPDPRPNRWPPRQPDYIYVPQQPTYVPQPQQAVPQPKPKPEPQETPLANKIVELPVDVVANAAPLSLMRSANPGLLAGMQQQIEAKTDQEIEAIQNIIDSIGPSLGTAVGNLGPGKAGGYGPDEESRNRAKTEILEKAKSGDVDFVNMATAGDNSPEAQRVREHARVQKALNDVRNATVNRTLNDSHRQRLMSALDDGHFITPLNRKPLEEHLRQLDTNNALAEIVHGAIPGGTVQPVDTLLLIGGMNGAEVIYLGNGAALVGTGGVTSGVVVSNGTVADAFGMTAGTGDSLADYDGNPLPEGTYIINRGPTEVNFVVAGKRYSLDSERMRSFVPDENDTIEFYRQGDTDKKTYKMHHGTYEFQYGDGKWELYRQTYKVTLDNANKAMEFHYVVNNEPHKLAPGSKQEHTSSYPLVFRFDNGKGEVKQKRAVSGTYRVAVTEDGVLDIFAASEVSEPAPPQVLAQPPHAVNLFSSWDQKAPGHSTSPSARRAPVEGAAPKLFD